MQTVRNVGVSALARELGLSAASVSLKMQKGMTADDIRRAYAAGDRPKRTGAQRSLEATGINSERIDRCLHDAQHAKAGAEFADQMGDKVAASGLRAKCGRLVLEAEGLYRRDLTSTWPHADDCEWPAPARTVAEMDAKAVKASAAPKLVDPTILRSTSSILPASVRAIIAAKVKLVDPTIPEVAPEAVPVQSSVQLTRPSRPARAATRTFERSYEDIIDSAEQGETKIDAECRKEIALASLREVELEQKRGELAPVRVLNQWFSTCIVRFRESLMHIGPELRDSLAVMTDSVEIERLITDRMRRALSELKEIKVGVVASGGGNGGKETSNSVVGMGAGENE